MAAFKDSFGETLPGVAAVAIQQGKAVAKNILADINGKNRKPFRYMDKGQLATIGRTKAVMELGSLRVNGFLAWLAWLFVHIYYLIGFRNRILVMVQWMFSFMSYRRGARLIQNIDWKSAED
jgi:NADH dehydrogenase